MVAQNLFANSRVNVTVEGKRNLSAVIGSTEYRDKHVKDLVKDWDNQLTILPIFVETKQQAAFICGFKSKLNYFLRTNPNIPHLLLLLERTIKNKFIPAYAVTRKEN